MVGLRMTGRSALIVIDLHEAASEDAWDGAGVVDRIAALAHRARHEDVPVVHVQRDASVRSSTAVENSRPDTRVAPQPGEWVVSSHYPDAFASTSLADILDSMDITHLVIAGARTDGAIRATVHRAIAEGWHVTLAGDCHTTSDTAWAGIGVSAQQVVSHANAELAFLEYPGRVVEVVSHDEATFSVAVLQGAA